MGSYPFFHLGGGEGVEEECPIAAGKFATGKVSFVALAPPRADEHRSLARSAARDHTMRSNELRVTSNEYNST